MNSLTLSSYGTLSYRDQGHGPAILLVHGWGVSGELFGPQLDGLSSRFRILAPDLPGHGESSPFPPDAPFAYLADAMAELIKAQVPGPVYLVGWSLGASVCWDLLARHPEVQVGGLVTIDMVPRVLNGPDWLFGLQEGEDYEVFGHLVQSMREDWKAYTGRMVSRIFSEETVDRAPDLLRRTQKIAAQNDPESMAALWQRLLEQDFRPQLAHIGVPCLVTCGARSQLYGVAAANWVCGQIEDAQLVVFPHSGHAPHLEETREFNQVLTQFIDRIEQQSSTNQTMPAQNGLPTS